ncbi:MAG: hypothetical protein ACOCT0_02650 [Halobacteriota archaeon]
MNQTETGRCPDCDEVYRGDEFKSLELDYEVVGDQVRSTNAVVCPGCDAVVAAYSDYHRTDVAEGGSETWERVKSIDEH